MAARSAGACSSAASIRARSNRATLPLIAGMVFQEPEAQAVARTVEDEIVFGLECMGSDRQSTRRRLEEALDALGIHHLRDRAIATLSGGELQRVAIASVLTMQPRVLLMDEPTSQLDPQAAHDVLGVLCELRDDLGLTVVVSEHRLDRLIAHADRVMLVPGDGTVAVGEARAMLAALPSAPPLVQIGEALGWAPLPLTIAEARRFAGSRDRAAADALPVQSAGDRVVGLRDVSVHLGPVPALRDVSLDLHEGEIVALMGRNGAGKTTLLRALAGLVTPQRGEVRFAVAPACGRAIPIVRVRGAGSVLDDVPVDGGTRGRGCAARDGARRVRREMRSPSGRSRQFAERNPRDLSVGERQRVALAAMLVGSPTLILLDEPTRGMDAPTKDLLISNLKRRASAGATIVLASHDVELAARCATRVVLLADGEVIADGAPRGVLADSVTFSTQANKLFGGDVLTVEDALAHARGDRMSRTRLAIVDWRRSSSALIAAAPHASIARAASTDAALAERCVPADAQSTAVHRAGLVVTFGDRHSELFCIEFTEDSITGLELLRRSGLPLVTSGMGGLGGAVCSIGGEGSSDPSNCFCRVPAARACTGPTISTRTAPGATRRSAHRSASSMTATLTGGRGVRAASAAAPFPPRRVRSAPRRRPRRPKRQHRVPRREPAPSVAPSVTSTPDPEDTAVPTATKTRAAGTPTLVSEATVAPPMQQLRRTRWRARR